MLNLFQEVNSNWNNNRQNSVELDFVIKTTIYGLIWVYFFERQESKENSMLQLWNVLPLCVFMRFVAFKQPLKKKSLEHLARGNTHVPPQAKQAKFLTGRYRGHDLNPHNKTCLR